MSKKIGLARSARRFAYVTYHPAVYLKVYVTFNRQILLTLSLHLPLTSPFSQTGPFSSTHLLVEAPSDGQFSIF
jgi:hypothetical protein